MSAPLEARTADAQRETGAVRTARETEAERYDDAPADLRRLQAEFGNSIRMPFDFSTGRFACAREAYADGAAEAVLPRGDQSSRDRLSVYNQQYWYRLLTVMQDDFPLLGAALGLWEFNRLASAYLDAHPSRSPLLDGIAAGFPAWLRAAGYAGQRDIGIADLEWARLKAFHAAGRAALDASRLTPEQVSALEDSPLALQPWLSVLAEDWNLVECRRDLDAGRAEKPVFAPGRKHWAVFRREGRVETSGLEPGAYRILRALMEGLSLDEACRRAARDGDEDALLLSLPGWFAAWTAAGWFIHPGAEAEG